MSQLKNKSKNNWYSIKAMANNSAEIHIYDEIGGWGITAQDFIGSLKDLGDVANLNVRINSPGGSVFEGNAIYNAIKNHKAKVNVYIDGIALSMGSVIAMAGDYISMAENGMLMVHNPYGVFVGDAEEMRKSADFLDKMKQTLINSYVNKTGLSAEAVSDAMDAETWMTAEEARDTGFIDEIDGSVDLTAHFDLTKFENTPKRFLPSGKSGKLKENSVMPDKIIEPEVVNINVDEVVAKAAKDALAADGKRRTSIDEIFNLHADSHDGLRESCLADTNLSAKDAGALLLDAIGKTSEPLGNTGRVETIADSADKFRAAGADAFAIRAGKKSDDGQNEFRAFSMFDMARHSLAMRNVSLKGMSKMQIVGAAFTHSSSDFPFLLENSLGKELQRAYGTFAETWRQIAAVSSVPDFKVNSRIRMGSFNSLDKIEEGGEYTDGTIGEEKETIQAVTKGKMISLTRQAIINDDLAGFMRIAGLMGRAAARTIGNDVYKIITDNAAMSDGVAIFHANHNNLAGTGSAPTAVTVGAARTAMRLRQDMNDNDYLDIQPSIILGPVELEDTLNVLMASETDPAQSNSRKPNPVRNIATVVTDPRLSADSTTAWYMIADPASVPLVEVAFLDGNETPYLESQDGFTVDGTRWKVRLDYGTDSIDNRGGYKNSGASGGGG